MLLSECAESALLCEILGSTTLIQKIISLCTTPRNPVNNIVPRRTLTY